LDDALAWARERGLSAEDDLSYLREFEHVTLARVLLARSTSDRADRSLLGAMGLLERLLEAAEAGERTGSAIDILILQALAHRMRGDVPAALAPLARALTLAEPEGYVRTFVDEGWPMAVLLEAAAKRGIVPSYSRRLLAAVGKAEDAPPAKQDLIEPLSERELHVLRLLGTDLAGPEIARELVVSLNTVRTHTKNIYAKLGVNSRRAAIRRAEARGLLSRTGNPPPEPEPFTRRRRTVSPIASTGSPHRHLPSAPTLGAGRPRRRLHRGAAWPARSPWHPATAQAEPRRTGPPPARGCRPTRAGRLPPARPPDREITTSITTCGDACSPDPRLSSDQANGRSHRRRRFIRMSNPRRGHDEHTTRNHRRSSEARTLRDPPQGAPRCPVGRLV
jgi:DNA-binding NarL/FixJ family response regulator